MSTEKVDPSRGAGKTTAFQAHLQQENAKLRGVVTMANARITELEDDRRGMVALRNVCAEHGTPLEKQSTSAEDIALWADAALREREARIAELEKK